MEEKCWICCTAVFSPAPEESLVFSRQQRSCFCTCIIHGCLINNSASGGYPGVAWLVLIKTFRGETVGVWCLLVHRRRWQQLDDVLPPSVVSTDHRLLNSLPTVFLAHQLLKRTSFHNIFKIFLELDLCRTYIYVYILNVQRFLAPSSLAMIGVNSLHSAGRLRSRSLCTVRYGRDFRMMDPFRYPRTPRSRSLKPLVFPDLLGKAQDGQNHPQARKRRKVLKTALHVICHC